MKIRIPILMGVLLLIVVAVTAWAASPTSVRIGETAAIGIATTCDGEVVFVANGYGIFRSKDGGETWTQVYQ